MKFGKIIPLLVTFITYSIIIRAHSDVKFEHINVEDGLSQGTIWTIFQDSKGYLWFGTEDGLNMYDGLEFRIIRNNPDDPNTPITNGVFCMDEDSRGNLWLGHDGGGLTKYDRKQNKFTRFKNDPLDSNSISTGLILRILADKSDNVWIVTNDAKLHRYDQSSGDFIRYNHYPDDPTSLSDDHITVINIDFLNLIPLYEDSEGIVWIGTPNGLNRYDPEKDSFVEFNHTGENGISLDDKHVLSIQEDSKGRLWISTINSGLYVFTKDSRELIRFIHDPDDPNSMVSSTVGGVFEDASGLFWISTDRGVDQLDFEKGTIVHINADPSIGKMLRNPASIPFYEDTKRDIWFLSFSGGIDRYNRLTNDFTHIVHDQHDPTSLSWNRILSYYLDKSGVLWIGTHGRGLNKYISEKNQFILYQNEYDNPNSLGLNFVRSVIEDKKGYLWVGLAGGGLDRINRETGEFKHYLNIPGSDKGPGSNNIWALHEDPEGIIWIGTFGGGLNRFDPSNGTFEYYVRDNDGDPTNSINSNFIRSMVQDEDGYLWIGAEGRGVNRFDPRTERFVVYDLYTPGIETPPQQANNVVRGMYISNIDSNIIWIGTDRGVKRFNRKTFEVKSYEHDPDNPNTLANNRVLSIYEDSRGILWVGTLGGGLNQFNRNDDTFDRITYNEGLPNNVIYGILEDKSGGLWLSSNSGLIKYIIPELSRSGRHEFVKYDVNDGLQSNEFNAGAYFKSPSGEMFFGGIRGLNSFSPEKITNNPIPPIIHITKLRVVNERNTEDRIPQFTYVDISDSYAELEHFQSSIRVEFVGLHYLDPAGNAYAYKLEGYDNNWIYSGSRRFVDYPNLPPGEYNFKVRASNSDNVWVENPAQLAIVILPPWWKSTWAYMIYSILIILGFASVYKSQKAKIISKEREEAKIREAELRAEAAEMKSRATEAQAKALKLENERKTHELEEARKLQLSMLPNEIPEVPDLDIAVYMRTATEVGGDYYDFHKADDGTLIAAIGDATGHGLKAGIMVSLIKGLFVSNINHTDISNFFERTSQAIKHMNLWNLYMALTLLKINKRRVYISAAGMPPIFIYRQDKKIVEMLKLKGMPLGAFVDFPYSDADIELKAGDKILLITDGLAELFNNNSEVFELERVRSTFLKYAYKNPKDIIDELVYEADRWQNGTPQNDDITFMVIAFK